MSSILEHALNSRCSYWPGDNCSQMLSSPGWQQAKLVEVPSRQPVAGLSSIHVYSAPLRLSQPLAWSSTSRVLVIEWSSSHDLLCQEPNECHHSRPPLLARPSVNNAICTLHRVHPEQRYPLQWTNTASGAGNPLNGSDDAAGARGGWSEERIGVCSHSTSLTELQLSGSAWDYFSVVMWFWCEQLACPW